MVRNKIKIKSWIAWLIGCIFICTYSIINLAILGSTTQETMIITFLVWIAYYISALTNTQLKDRIMEI